MIVIVAVRMVVIVRVLFVGMIFIGVFFAHRVLACLRFVRMSMSGVAMTLVVRSVRVVCRVFRVVVIRMFAHRLGVVRHQVEAFHIHKHGAVVGRARAFENADDGKALGVDVSLRVAVRRVDFVAQFDGFVVVVVVLVATLGKVLGCRLAARWAGLAAREAWAIGFGLNARGAMDIILGMLALRAGIIQEKLFVAIVIMALVTSMISGTLIQRILRSEKRVGADGSPCPKALGKPIDIDDVPDPILEPVEAACDDRGEDPHCVDRELEMSVRE